jgi:gliding motility-associated-like protein
MKGSSTVGAPLITQYIVGVYNNDNGAKVNGTAANSNWACSEDFSGTLPVPIIVSPCIDNPPTFNYVYKTYSFVIELPDNNAGYTVAFQTFSRQNSFNVVANEGANYSCIVPGLNTLPSPKTDNSPQYKLPISVICENNRFTLDFSATDVDGDSLVYAFCDAYNGGLADQADYQNTAAPPYSAVTYVNPYTSAFPLGSQATINSQTGIISGISPPAGRYVICVCASVYRNGNFITVHRKDLIVEVSGCIPLKANPNFTPVTCDGFDVSFTDQSTGNPDTYFWDFGDPASGVNNTSTSPNPNHIYTTAGTYNVKLKVSLVGQCEDSITKPLGVFPGFFPGFTAAAPLCVGQPVQFTDTTKTNYGIVDSWRWDFGDGATLADTSHLQNPLYTYNPAGNYTVQLIVTNSKGCVKTVNVPVTINDVTALSVFPKDTIYCGLDTLQLTGTGAGNYIWTPNYNILNANSSNPSVYPAVTTKYYAELTNSFGCKSKDSLTIYPKFDLTNAIAGPTNICEEDTVTLTGTANYSTNITWQWSPPGTLGSPNSDITLAYPIVNTNYTLTTRWGSHCVATKTHNINVKPLANPNAGPDSYICPGNNDSTQLIASGGNSYLWTPTAGLSNSTIPNPMASPPSATNYIVWVGVTGCSKLRSDTVLVDVGTPPVLNTLNDTLICIIDTLQLTTTGTGNYNWAPNYMINSTTAQSPLVSPDVPTWYYVRLTDAVGCYKVDSVFVDVKQRVTIDAGPDTAICQKDIITLRPTSDALHYIWTPSTYLDDPTLMHPLAQPLTSIKYHVIGNIGNCQNEDSVFIKVGPYPSANAGPDLKLCPGFSTQLRAIGGSSYLWVPNTFLNDRKLPDPTCTLPFGSIKYIVTVTDTLGCPKAVRDTVDVIVHPKAVVDAGPRDTSVVNGQPLQLNATGNGTGFLWSPSLWLSSNIVPDPISLPQGDIKYLVTATTVNGCVAKDSIFVKYYSGDADIFVPNAFTPNGDRWNNTFEPILRGIISLSYFRVFNRFGEMVFATAERDKGWDGSYKGRPQDPGTFVWYTEGITYRGEVRRKKGFVILIR